MLSWLHPLKGGSLHETRGGSIFISYSHKDKQWKDRIVQYLRVLADSGVTFWSDDAIPVGAQWLEVIEAAMAECQVALLLISAEYLSSSFLINKEVQTLLMRRQVDDLLVIPVILRSCAWQEVDWLVRIQVFPRTGVPLDRLNRYDRELSLVDLTREIAVFLKVGQSLRHIRGEIFGYGEAQLPSEVSGREAGIPSPDTRAGTAGVDHPLLHLYCDDDVRYVLRHAVNRLIDAPEKAPPILATLHILYALFEVGGSDGPVTTARNLRASLGKAVKDDVIVSDTRSTWPAAAFTSEEWLPDVSTEVETVLDLAKAWAGADPVDLPAFALALVSERSKEADIAFGSLTLLTQADVRESWLNTLRAEASRAGRDPSRYDHWLFGDHIASPAGVLPDLGRPRDARDDCLEVRRYALALAATAVACDTQPPLAIGVFGDWGAGKSHFMGLMEHEMRALATGPDERFHRHVLPVWFNAWHYADANLWASLMQALLEAVDAYVNASAADDARLAAGELERLRTALDLAVQFRAEAGADDGIAQQALQEAQAGSQAKEQALSAARANAAAQESTLERARQAAFEAGLARLAGQLRTDASPGQTPLAALAAGFAAQVRTLGLDGLADTAGQFANLSAAGETGLAGLRTLLADARVQAARTRTTFDWLLAAPLGIRPWQLALGGIGLLGLAAGLYWAAARWLPAGGFPTLGALAVLIGGALTPALVWAKDRLAQVRAALDRLDALRSGLDAGLAQAVEADADVQQARAALDAARQTQAEAQTAAEAAGRRLAEARQKVVDTGEALREQLRSERLGDYLRTRLASDDYRSRLGLVATIRRDLNRLAAFLVPPDWALAVARQSEDAIPDPAALNRAAPPSARAEEIAAVASLCAAGIPLRSRPLDRIVLFIDDLDRCPPERVVEVLEAVHLLLAMPLFVVVVGVDVRWVSAALCKRYDGLLVGEHSDIERARPTATPTDYLEKIFQLPFRLSAIETATGNRLLRSLTGTQADRAAAGDGKTATPVAIGDSPLDAIATGSANPELPAERKTDQPDKAIEEERREVGAHLDISSDETDFMEKLLASLGGSPRRVRRFVNSYRVYKASLRTNERKDQLEGNRYRTVLVALALQIGLGHRLDEIRKCAPPSAPAENETATDKRDWLDAAKLDPIHRARLDNALDALKADGDTPVADEYQRLLDLLNRSDIARFSFAPTQR